ncbi:recombination regulator RecX [Comamonas endophytica]|uniref:Regulatory protein RecX n=1 Tax=Comamonas endophytica TaxID=2949090 RepID=A0ABY6G5R7_9BURK|nr:MULTISPECIES: recombination regulator RecX [unclassified Acidovorax]MCD2512302.1 recombination regulator RecX [Acidovorax sp. D4N7]UYG50241.1 recombination regulator RecX [Acidovorax sp. 5MLIR]
MVFSTLSLKGRALRLLAQREHSRLELERKLASHVAEGEDLAAVLDELESKDFINPERVAQSVAYRRGSRLGTARVVQEMRSKGLDDDTVRAATLELRATEWQRAHAIWRQRFGAPAETPQEKLKQMRFLASRGFSGEVVRKVVGGQAPEEASG